MSGEITHIWNGSVLTVISDSGASSADLQGPKGDTGPRGPQGPAGVILDEQGNVVVDLSPYMTYEEADQKIKDAMGDVDLSDYATKDYVQEQDINNRQDLTDYATKNYVAAEIAKAQLPEGDVDVSTLATKEDLEKIEVNIDNKTIIKDGNGKLRTAIGGYPNNGGAVNFAMKDFEFVPCGPWNDWNRRDVGNIGQPFCGECLYHITMTFKDGGKFSFDMMFEEVESGIAGEEYALVTYDEYDVYDKNTHISSFYAHADGGFDYDPKITDYTPGMACKSAWILTSITITADDCVPINGMFIPVDGSSIQVNSEGKLVAVSGGASLSDYYTKAEIDNMDFGGGSDVDLSNYYTKAEVDAIALDGDVDLSNYYTKAEVSQMITSTGFDKTQYYTKSEVDAKIPTMSDYYTKEQIDNKILYGTTALTPGVSSLPTGTLYVVYE